MDLHEYRRAVERLSFGKKLPTAVYVYRDARVSLGEDLDRLVGQVVVALQIGPEFNVLKFRTDELKVSCLSYPGFFEEAHPALRKAVTIDLRSGTARHNDYAASLHLRARTEAETFEGDGLVQREVQGASSSPEGIQCGTGAGTRTGCCPAGPHVGL